MFPHFLPVDFRGRFRHARYDEYMKLQNVIILILNFTNACHAHCLKSLRIKHD